MSTDLYFAPAVRDTLIIAAIAIPLQIALGLAMALLVQTRFAGHAVSSTCAPCRSASPTSPPD